MLVLKNPTAMPVAWRLVALDVLGDDFTCPEKEGSIKPYGTGNIPMVFHPARPVILQKKSVKVEASIVSFRCVFDLHFFTNWICSSVRDAAFNNKIINILDKQIALLILLTVSAKIG